jgi:hypothetical protein
MIIQICGIIYYIISILALNKCQSFPCLYGGLCQNNGGRYKCICPLNRVGYICDKEQPNVLPVFTSISKNFGLLAGGGNLTLNGINLNNFPVLGAYFIPEDTTRFQVLYGYTRNTNISTSLSNFIIIEAPKAPNDSYIGAKFNIIVEYTGPINIATNLTYTYTGNPIIQDIQPRIQLSRLA